jgi:hypothetical protein
MNQTSDKLSASFFSVVLKLEELSSFAVLLVLYQCTRCHVLKFSTWYIRRSQLGHVTSLLLTSTTSWFNLMLKEMEDFARMLSHFLLLLFRFVQLRCIKTSYWCMSSVSYWSLLVRELARPNLDPETVVTELLYLHSQCCGFALKILTPSFKSLPVHHFIRDRWCVTFTINYTPLTFSVKREYVKLLNGKCDLTEFNPTPMEQSHSWKANSRHFWKLKVYYHVHNSVSFVPIVNHIKSFEVLPSYFVKVHFNIILPSMQRSSKWSPAFRPSHQSPVCVSVFRHACYITSSFQPRFYYHIIIWRGILPHYAVFFALLLFLLL